MRAAQVEMNFHQDFFLFLIIMIQTEFVGLLFGTSSIIFLVLFLIDRATKTSAYDPRRKIFLA